LFQLRLNKDVKEKRNDWQTMSNKANNLHFDMPTMFVMMKKKEIKYFGFFFALVSFFKHIKLRQDYFEYKFHA
jgi:hypothetical protein